MYVNIYLIPHITSGIIGHELSGVETTMEGYLGIGDKAKPSFI